MDHTAGDRGTGGNILVVDDSPDYVRAISRILRRQGYDVRSAADGETALALLQAAPPDLILLDIMMPGMDGHEVCRRLKADDATRCIPVIFISGENDVVNKVHAFASGGVDYITKPFQNEEVLARIKTHLTLYGLQKHLEERVGERTAALEAANALLNQEIAERKEIEAALRELAAHRDAVREHERKRIAGEIHDELGSLLTALKMDISLLRMRIGDDPEIQDRIAQMRELVEKTIHMVRHVATQLRPAALNLGIVPALEWLREEFCRRTGIACALATDGEVGIDDARATAIFRIVQESLTNVTRHAQASHVAITLAHENAEIVLRIVDNGQGFDPARVRGGAFGLLGIRERAQTLGATVHIESAPGAGSAVSIRMAHPGTPS